MRPFCSFLGMEGAYVWEEGWRKRRMAPGQERELVVDCKG